MRGTTGKCNAAMLKYEHVICLSPLEHARLHNKGKENKGFVPVPTYKRKKGGKIIQSEVAACIKGHRLNGRAVESSLAER
eukprot:1141205-Pelagomonas_calceolata.AAC.1